MAGMLNICSRSFSRNLFRGTTKHLRDASCDQHLSGARAYHRNGVRIASNGTSSFFSRRFNLESQNQPSLLVSRSIKTSSALCGDTKDVVVPPFADSVSDGDVRWEKNVGDTVAEDDTVCEIETDKTSIPVRAPGNGVIEEQYVEDGATVKAGEKLFRIKLN